METKEPMSAIINSPKPEENMQLEFKKIDPVNNFPIPQDWKAGARSENTLFVDEAWEAGNRTVNAIHNYIKEKHGKEIPRGSISGRLHKIRKFYQLAPEKIMTPRKPEEKQEKAELVPVRSLERGQFLATELVKWVAEMRDQGFVIDLKTAHEEGELVGIDIDFHLSIRA